MIFDRVRRRTNYLLVHCSNLVKFSVALVEIFHASFLISGIKPEGVVNNEQSAALDPDENWPQAEYYARHKNCHN